MRMEPFFRRWLLPVLLAACILMLGALAPSYLLDHQARGLLHSTNAVPVEDVRPYGDDYNEMINALLAAIRLQNSDGFGIPSSRQDIWDNGQIQATIDQFDAFQSELSVQVADRGYWLEGLVQLIYANYSPLTNTQREEWLLYLDCWDVNSSRYSYVGVVPELGVPVFMVLDVIPQEYVDPQALWEALVATYQQRYGLIFTDTEIEMSDAQGGNEQSLDEMQVQQWLEQYGFDPENEAADGAGDMQESYRFGAVSSDFTVELGMRITVVNDGHLYLAVWLDQAEGN